MNNLNKVLSLLGILNTALAAIHIIFGDIQRATFSTAVACLMFILAQQQEGK